MPKELSDVLKELRDEQYNGQLVWIEFDTGFAGNADYYEEAMGFVVEFDENEITLAGMKKVAGNRVQTDHTNTYPLNKIRDMAVIVYDAVYRREPFSPILPQPQKDTYRVEIECVTLDPKPTQLNWPYDLFTTNGPTKE